MYARASYITAVGIVELPYLIAQTIVFVPISYFMIGELSAQPVFPLNDATLSGCLSCLTCIALTVVFMLIPATSNEAPHA